MLTQSATTTAAGATAEVERDIDETVTTRDDRLGADVTVDPLDEGALAGWVRTR